MSSPPPFNPGPGRKQGQNPAFPWLIGLGLILVTAKVPALLGLIWVALWGLALWGLWKRRIDWIWKAMAATPGLEVWSRMQDQITLPYEIGKYSLAYLFLLLGIHHWNRGGAPPAYSLGKWIFLLLIPSLFVALPRFEFGDWVFNALGMLLLAGGLWILARQRWSIDFWFQCIQGALWPLLGVLVYLSIHNPIEMESQFFLGAASTLTDGFGANQVSTILGLGFFLTALLLVGGRPFFPYLWMNYLLLAGFMIRGMLSFSRGGMLVAIVATLFLLVPVIFSRTRPLWLSLIRFFAIAAVALVGFAQLNAWTDNTLWLRYLGETPGTLSGSREKTLSVITSGRTEIIRTDLEMFRDYPLFGLGPGQSMHHRPDYGYPVAAAHTEVTRLCAEHGIGGLIVSILWLGFAVWWFLRQKNTKLAWMIAGMFFLAWGSSLHSAMRTNLTVVIYLLASVPLYRIRKEDSLSPSGTKQANPQTEENPENENKK